MEGNSHIQAILHKAAALESNAAGVKYDTTLELAKPFYLLRPKIGIDGNQWFCLYGDDLQNGVAGFGDTPEKAVDVLVGLRRISKI